MDAGHRFVRLGTTVLAALLSILSGTACRTAEGPAQIFIARSGDSGRTFAAPVGVSDDAATARASGEQAPRVAIGGDRWSAIEPLSNGSPASYPAVASTADGAVVVWTNHTTPYSASAVSQRPNHR